MYKISSSKGIFYEVTTPEHIYLVDLEKRARSCHHKQEFHVIMQ